MIILVCLTFICFSVTFCKPIIKIKAKKNVQLREHSFWQYLSWSFLKYWAVPSACPHRRGGPVHTECCRTTPTGGGSARGSPSPTHRSPGPSPRRPQTGSRPPPPGSGASVPTGSREYKSIQTPVRRWPISNQLHAVQHSLISHNYKQVWESDNAEGARYPHYVQLKTWVCSKQIHILSF